jgi:hypothetical protein
VQVDVAQQLEQKRWGGGVAQGGAHLPNPMPPLVFMDGWLKFMGERNFA